MTVDAFVDARFEGWTELEALLASAGRRPERLGSTKLRRLGALYRAAAADLAIARRRWPSEPVVNRLEDLVARARLVVYGRTTRAISMRSFFVSGYWRRVVQRPGLLAVSALLLFAPAGLTALWGHDDPVAASELVPGGLRTAGPDDGGDLGLASNEQAAMSSQIMTNNIGVTFAAFAGGITAGVATTAILVFNGALLGAVAGISLANGNGGRFVELVSAHGVLELSCIVVAGAAGLRVGGALIDPGTRPRGAAVADAARAAAELALGTAPWLVVAGLVEGFVTPKAIGPGGAAAVGFTLGAIFWALVLVRGRATGPLSTSS